jgi:hypothetical protein
MPKKVVVVHPHLMQEHINLCREQRERGMRGFPKMTKKKASRTQFARRRFLEKYIASEDENGIVVKWDYDDYVLKKNSGVFEIFKILKANSGTISLQAMMDIAYLTGQIDAALNDNPKMERSHWGVLYTVMSLRKLRTYVVCNYDKIGIL